MCTICYTFHVYFEVRINFSIPAFVTSFSASFYVVLQAGWLRFRFPIVSLEFFIYKVLPDSPRWTEPLTELSTGNISLRGKDGRCVGLTTLPLHVPIF